VYLHSERSYGILQKHNTSLFVTFIDASKAFDRVNHWTLFHKLIERGVPLYLVKILVVWYTSQDMKVRWGRCVSEPFNVSNGIKQGGVLSPWLFNLYMDKLSIELSKLNIGARLAGRIMNHLGYADDLCIMSLTSCGMQRLLQCCDEYAIEHDLLFNGAKSVCMLFKPRNLKLHVLPDLVLNGKTLLYAEHLCCMLSTIYIWVLSLKMEDVFLT
jgi:hypothetical protein